MANFTSDVPPLLKPKVLRREYHESWDTGNVEQSSFSCKTNLVQKLSRFGDVAIDFVAGIIKSENMRLRAQQKKFMTCDVHSELLIATKANVVLTFVFQILESKFRISGSAEVNAAAKVFREKRATLLGKKTKKCAVSLGLDATQVLTSHIS